MLDSGRARRATAPFVLDDLVSYVDMLGDHLFFTFIGFHHLFCDIARQSETIFNRNFFNHPSCYDLQVIYSFTFIHLSFLYHCLLIY